MPRSTSRHRLLGLEALETRTLLAGDGDPFGLLADFAATQKALSGSGDFTANFSTNFGNHQLVLVGKPTSTVTIDLGTLPDFITNISISSFSEVNFVGTDKVETLILNDVGTVTAPHLTVTSIVAADHVDSLTIGAVTGKTLLLSGNATGLNVPTLGSDTLIISDLNKLTLDSTSKSITVLSSNDSQTLNLRYTPEVVGVSGMPTSSVHILLPGSTGNGPSTGPNVGSDAIIPPVVSSGPLVGTGDNNVNIGGGSGSNPTDSVVTPPATTDTPDPNRVVIVSLPADERTRAFIAELRGLLHSDSDSHQQVIDLVSHSAPNANLNGLLTQKVTLPLTNTPATMRVEVDGHIVEMQGAFQTEPSAAAYIEPTPSLVERHFDNDVFVDRPLTLPTTTSLALETVLAPNVDVAFTAPVVSAASGGIEVDRARVGAAQHERDSHNELGAAVMALGTYLVERVSAEFSPGQQSIVLLVDPKPSRPATSQRGLSAIDVFAQGGTGDDRRVI